MIEDRIIEGYDDLKQSEFSKKAERKKNYYYYKSDEELKLGNKILSNYYNTIAEFYEFLQQEYYSTNISFQNSERSLEERILLHSYSIINEIEIAQYHLLKQENIYALERIETAKIFYTTLYSLYSHFSKPQKNKKNNNTNKNNIIYILKQIIEYSYIQLNLLELNILYNLKHSTKKEEKKLHRQILTYKKNFPFNYENPQYDTINTIRISIILSEIKEYQKETKETKKNNNKKTKKKKKTIPIKEIEE